MPRLRLAFAFLIGASACARTAITAPTPAPGPATRPALPPVPAVDGPIAIRVVYPRPDQVVTSRDSNFIFGSIGSGRATLRINGHAARVYPNGAFMAFIPNPPAPSPRYELVVERAGESVRSTLPIAYPAPREAVAPAPVAPVAADAAKPEGLATSRADTLATLFARFDSLRSAVTRDEPVGWVQLGVPNAATDSDRVVIGRPVPGGTYKWFFLPGTVVPLVGRDGGFARVRLDRELDVYVDTTEARGVEAPVVARRVAANMRVRPSADGVDLVIPIGTRAPYFVEETDRAVVLTLYGVRGNTDLINYAGADSMVRTVEWAQESADRARITVGLRAAPYGYLVVWENNALVLKLRGRPRIDPARPLAGIVVAVDPGHPPVGATGPTGLWEPQVTLPVGLRLKTLLEERGARVVMTRTTADAVALGDRPIIARRANVHAFVSIHLNAYPDGVNPFVAPGTGTYFFRAHSEPLARAVQRGMVDRMGLQDLGVNYDNLAVVRPTWYPSVLCEGAFIMLPDQEAALRTPEFQDRYARGVADGLESYFRGLAVR
ncbi:MAG TPA: N-acetylmuramoyl-L-alanine amidase [Gemmatimonadaceae bacterium]|nr:N-acetylmuramoyl-L-alanine amidase [Gemmatimonadaceae bacterium]